MLWRKRYLQMGMVMELNSALMDRKAFNRQREAELF